MEAGLLITYRNRLKEVGRRRRGIIGSLGPEEALAIWRFICRIIVASPSPAPVIRCSAYLFVSYYPLLRSANE